MRASAEYARRLRRLWAALARRYGKLKPTPVGDPADELIRAALMRFAPETRVGAAVARLRAGTVDLNDLRVTSPPDAAELLGRDFPRALDAGAGVVAALNALFNKRHTADAGIVSSLARRDAVRLMRSLPGLHPHDAALFVLRVLKAHAVPVDPRGLQLLVREKAIDPAWSHAAAQEFLEKHIPASQSEAFYLTVKRHAAALGVEEAAPAPPEPRPAASELQPAANAAATASAPPRPNAAAKASPPPRPSSSKSTKSAPPPAPRVTKPTPAKPKPPARRSPDRKHRARPAARASRTRRPERRR